ncbi:hypothetical protein [Natrinema pallidum]|nr:hypothetical protein [Natrinema pallidum]
MSRETPLIRPSAVALADRIRDAALAASATLERERAWGQLSE